MFPLRLAWAWTIWKAQGQTMRGKIVMDLGKNEREHRLTYTAFSCATRFADIGIIGGLTEERFTTSILKHKKVKPRIEEEKWLADLSARTMVQYM